MKQAKRTPRAEGAVWNRFGRTKALTAWAAVFAFTLWGCTSPETESTAPADPVDPQEVTPSDAVTSGDRDEGPGGSGTSVEVIEAAQDDNVGKLPERDPVTPARSGGALAFLQELETEDDSNANETPATKLLDEVETERSEDRTAPPGLPGSGGPKESLEDLLADVDSSGSKPPPGAKPTSTTLTPNDPSVTRSGDEPPPAPPPVAPEGGAPDVATAGGSADTPPEAPKRERFVRAGQHSFHMELSHKETTQLYAYLRDTYPEWIEKGHLYRVKGKGRSLIVFTEKPLEQDELGKQIVAEIEAFDMLDLRIQHRVVRPRYIEPENLMKAMVMAGVANVYELADQSETTTYKQGAKTVSVSRTNEAYRKKNLIPGEDPTGTPPRYPYVYNVGQSDPFKFPAQYSGQNTNDRILVTFDKTASTEERGGLVVVGTDEDVERIQAFVDSVDVPARQIMIEIQVIELDANKLSDFGLDSLQFGSGKHIGTVALPLPGEQIVQPGLGADVRGNPEEFVPDVLFEGFDFAFDDTSFDLSGRFLSRVHWLVREGDAKIKARPKLLTLDDRTSVLHIGREEPVFQSTGVTRDTNNGNIVNEIRQVTTQYVGFTLNIRPRVSGGAEDEVSLQLEVVVNELDQRTRVFEEDLAGIPSVIKRHYIGMNRVKNHRPLILGGLIQETEVENVNKIPLLADIPLLGYLFRRTQKAQTRNEIILVVTPHILSERGVDRAATPKESIHFDTFDSVLFNDRHILKGSDIVGIDPINRVPARNKKGRVFREEEVVDLTLLNVVKKRNLISKLGIIDNYLPEEAAKLNWFQRRAPERTVSNWPDEEKEIFFRAAAILIENIKELNEGLYFEDLVIPRREIILPTTPYRISLSYDRVKAIEVLARSEGIIRGRDNVDEDLVKLLQEASGSDLRAFADHIEGTGREAKDHKEIVAELDELYSRLSPGRPPLRSLASYAAVYRALDRADIDFKTIATFFSTNLHEGYLVEGSPEIGLFRKDLSDFTKSSLSLGERARRLKALEDKWQAMNVED